MYCIFNFICYVTNISSTKIFTAANSIQNRLHRNIKSTSVYVWMVNNSIMQSFSIGRLYFPFFVLNHTQYRLNFSYTQTSKRSIAFVLATPWCIGFDIMVCLVFIGIFFCEWFACLSQLRRHCPPVALMDAFVGTVKWNLGHGGCFFYTKSVMHHEWDKTCLLFLPSL